MAENYNFLQKIFVTCVLIYRACLSPFFGQHCRFEPTCSHYMIEAIKKRGALSGLCLGFYRLLRCHPFCQGGYDPVTPVEKKL